MDLHPAYIAGIVDGEGHIGIARGYNGRPPHRYLRHNLTLAVTNADMNLLYLLKEDLGGFVTARREKGKGMAGDWRITGWGAVKVLNEIRSYMIVKERI